MRWIRWAGFLAVAIGVAAGLVGATPGPACACSCVESSLRENIAGADVVFAGTLRSREEPDGLLRSSADKATLVFEVSSVYKGKVSARQEIVTHASGASCGLELTGPGPHLVFGNTNASDFEPEPAAGQYVSSLCGGSHPLDAATRAELRPLGRATEPVPARAGTVEPDSVEASTNASTGRSAVWWLAGGAAALVALGATGLVWWRRARTRAG